jgi:predicted phosphodiesterase
MENPNSPKPTPLEERIKDMSEAEQKVLLKQLGNPDMRRKTYDHAFSRKRKRIGVISDTHIGHEEFKEELLLRAFKYFEKQKVDGIYHAGDILEGMSGRPGHVYELDKVGLTAQLNYAADLFSQTDLPIYGITGNHDQWYMKKGDAGADVGQMLEDKIENFHYLGMNEADVILGDDVKMRLFHGNDGSAYAISYKMQKLIESMPEKERPQIIFSGHYHKAMSMYSRGTYGFEAGTICGQSEFMRGKKIPAHVGFWAADIYMKKGGGIERVTSTFINE